MELNLTGETRLYAIIGDPIAQVKSPAGVTAAFYDKGHDGIVVPIRVAAPDLDAFLKAAYLMTNLDGIIITVPHKFRCFTHCRSTTDRANFLGAVNLMRRRAGGGWHGEMVDGQGFIGAVSAKDYNPVDKRALVVGAGGAGSAIAFALLESGVSELAVHDTDIQRRDQLIKQLQHRTKVRVTPGSRNPYGFDLVANATPSGMTHGDPLPVDVDKLSSSTFVGCVVTVPVIPPLIQAAREIGCPTSTGSEMYQALQESMVEFLMGGERVG